MDSSAENLLWNSHFCSLNFSNIVCIWYSALNLCLTTVSNTFCKNSVYVPCLTSYALIEATYLDIFTITSIFGIYVTTFHTIYSLSLLLAYWKFSSITLSVILNPHFIDIFISLIYDQISFIALSSIYPLVCFLIPHLCDIVEKLCSQSYW
jgi:hypothetical protein